MYNNKNIQESVMSSDIENAETRLNIDNIFQELNLPSLPRIVFQEYEMKSAVGKVFNLTSETLSSNNEKLKLVSKKIELPNVSQTVRSDLSLEAIEDLTALYGDPLPYIAKMLKGVANNLENKDFIKFLKENSQEVEELTPTKEPNSETHSFELMDRVQKEVLKMNNLTARTFYAWAIVPYKTAGALMTTYAFTSGLNTVKTSDLLIADLNLTKYYLNPDPKDNYVYIGLKHPLIETLSSGFIGYYKSYIQQVDATESGNKFFYIFNRYAFCTSPLHTTLNPMMIKFKINYN